MTNIKQNIKIMKSYRYKILAFGMALAGMASCSDSFLDKVPDERTEIDSPNKVVQLLVSAYPDYCPAWVGEISSDNLIDNQAPHMPSSPNSEQIEAYYNYSSYGKWDDELFKFQPASNATYSTSDSPGALWSAYYSSVATVNQALAGIERVAPNGNLSDTLRAAKGEALLLRAYDHFMLVNIFSQAYKNAEASKKDVGVPYVTEIEDVVTKNYDRINVDSVYKLIGKDLEEGLGLISDLNFGTAPKYHFNTNAAHAFAARYYLFHKDYEKVIEHANAVLGTDSASFQRMTMDLSQFDGCATMSDYGNVWQSPDQNGNLMLIATYSVLQRRIFGYRYSFAGPSASNAMMIRTGTPLWSGLICPPTSAVSGQIFSNSSHDYGYISCKVREQFEFTDKIAGIGYAHQIYRAFTSNALLLERAEAEIMLGKYEDAANDLRWYWNCPINTYSADDYATYVDGGRAKFMTDAVFDSYYGADKTACPNNFSSWDFTQNMSSDFVVPAEATKYMNCLNDFRRYETAFEGLRFFDVKRWGIEYTHTVGVYEDLFEQPWNSVNRAIEVPWETLSAGLESSRETQSATTDKSASMDEKSLIINSK